MAKRNNTEDNQVKRTKYVPAPTTEETCYEKSCLKKIEIEGMCQKHYNITKIKEYMSNDEYAKILSNVSNYGESFWSFDVVNFYGSGNNYGNQLDLCQLTLINKSDQFYKDNFQSGILKIEQYKPIVTRLLLHFLRCDLDHINIKGFHDAMSNYNSMSNVNFIHHIPKCFLSDEDVSVNYGRLFTLLKYNNNPSFDILQKDFDRSFEIVDHYFIHEGWRSYIIYGKTNHSCVLYLNYVSTSNPSEISDKLDMIKCIIDISKDEIKIMTGIRNNLSTMIDLLS